MQIQLGTKLIASQTFAPVRFSLATSVFLARAPNPMLHRTKSATISCDLIPSVGAISKSCRWLLAGEFGRKHRIQKYFLLCGFLSSSTFFGQSFAVIYLNVIFGVFLTCHEEREKERLAGC